jgi:hypothetical protein
MADLSSKAEERPSPCPLPEHRARGRQGHQVFERFVRRVHRRQVLLETIERSGLGMLGGCAAALPLILILLWRGQSAGQIASGALAVGAIAGMIWGIVTRPSLMNAAMEADRQLKWDDLLSSAWAIRGREREDSWAGMLIAMAETHCAETSPSAVVLNRLGARAWGGIGLAAALVGVLGLLPAVTAPPSEANAVSSSAVASDETPFSQKTDNPAGGSYARHSAVQAEPDDPNSSHIDGMSPDSSHAPAGEKQSDDPGTHRKPGDSSADGQGTGSSQSSHPGEYHLATPQDGTSAENNPGKGKATGGVGASARRAKADGPASGQLAGAAAGNQPGTPPWQSADWAQDAERANQAVESGRVPDAYRDVIRAYFERH